ncbi:unnamed protein product [Scytosiphon promiscuus]
MVIVKQKLDKLQPPPVEICSWDPVGQGIMFFAYGAEVATMEHYLEQALVSARRIKSLNPGTNITIVTNPGVTPDMEGALDVVIHVEKQYLYPGRLHSWTTSNIRRQWLTRLEYLACSPYNVTLALDSQALCCASGVDKILEQSWGEFDISFATQGPRRLASHNWAIMFRLNDRTLRLFDRWRTLQREYMSAGSDQLTLHVAAGSLALQDKVNVGVLSQNVALATVIYNQTGREYPKSSTLIDPRPVHFVHYDAQSEEDADTTCEKLNSESNRPRVLLLPKPFLKDKETKRRIKNTYEMAYSEEELRAAAHAAGENAAYFRGLDWENGSGKWGHVATPWKDHYPDCWKDLAEEVNEGVRHIYHDPKHIWANRHFAAEFADDNLQWPEWHQ